MYTYIYIYIYMRVGSTEEHVQYVIFCKSQCTGFEDLWQTFVLPRHFLEIDSESKREILRGLVRNFEYIYIYIYVYTYHTCIRCCEDCWSSAAEEPATETICLSLCSRLPLSLNVFFRSFSLFLSLSICFF